FLQRSRVFTLKSSSRIIFPQAGENFRLQQRWKRLLNTPPPFQQQGLHPPLSTVRSKSFPPVMPQLLTQSLCPPTTTLPFQR
ncbi:hypothetical protein ATANTOWER_000198, partial [Ataeniobius toweri]|nr:hypothetical protein [Ataeniobius toweri]